MNYSSDNIIKIRRELNSRGRRRAHKITTLIATLLLVAVIGVIAAAVSAGLGAFRGMIDTAPDISNIDVTPTGFSTFVYDNQGKQTAKLVSTDSNRIPVTMDMVPKDLQHAFVAIEDERFYDHHGIDIQGIFRAAYLGLKSGSFSQGASTITQQLIKNNVFTGWTDETFSESIRRKIQEQYLAVELEKKMSKDDILLNYMNTINLGHNTLGVQAASMRYFGKPVSKLTLSECAVIAGITQNPTRYDPITYPEKNAKRREKVLSKMLENGFISRKEYQSALDDDVYSRIKTVDNKTNDNQINSYFVDALTEQVTADLVKKGYTETQAFTLLYSGGLNIYSTQDAKLQKIVDDAVSDESIYPNGTRWYLNYNLSVQDTDGTVQNYSTQMLETYFKQKNPYFTLIFRTKDDARAAEQEYKEYVLHSGGKVIAESENITPQPQISLTLEDQHTGAVLAMSGGRGEKTANRTLNRAVDVVRQPGSTFKVVSTYAPALDAAGLTLATTQDDAPYTYADGTPVRNWYGEAYRGLSSLRLGIQNSMNIVTVKTLVQITPQLGFDYLKKFGFTTLVEREEIGGKVYSDIQPTLALGGITKGVKNIELNGAYAAIANGGEYIEPKLYTKITDHDGNVILDASQDAEKRRVLKATTAWLLTSAMEDVVTKGTGTAVNFGTTPIAGKTGTTSDENDVWFSGYTDYYTCTTWAGYDENTDLVFAEDDVPTETCDVHYQGMVCAIDGLPATDECPFKVSDVTTFKESGLKCHHTAEFMARADINEVLAEEQQELAAKQAQAQAEAAGRQAASAVEAANANLQAAAAALKAAQDQLVAAQQSGDTAAAQTAAAAAQTATENYNTALQQQAAALAAAQAAAQAQNNQNAGAVQDGQASQTPAAGAGAP